MVTLLLVTRRFELAQLDREDVDAETGRVLVRCGKGGKTAATWIPETGLPAVRRWLEVRGDAPGELSSRTYWHSRAEAGSASGMLCAFKALQLQRTESRMFWNAAVSNINVDEY